MDIFDKCKYKININKYKNKIIELITTYNYKKDIYERYDSFVFLDEKINNYGLSKIFEYYSCIQLSEKYKSNFEHYEDIDPNFKELHKMSYNDTGIDACNLIDTIVQCKLRKDSLTWGECGTFFGSQNIFDSELKKTIVKWKSLIITRNKECKLSKNLKEKHELFTDITYPREELIDYCNNLIENPPKIKKIKDIDFNLRDYQLEAIDIINKNDNVIISLPTGTGKNILIIFSIHEKKRYLILVPRIILMEQLKKEIIKHKPELKNNIQTIGDKNNEYNENKDITICVYNSVSIIEKYCDTFDKIYIDEAHHINVPYIYEDDDIDYYNELNDSTEKINTSIKQINPDDESNMSDEEYYTDEEYNSDDEYNTDEESILIDDSEDEIKNTSGYNKIIKSLSKYKNNVYLSATIDDANDFTYYNKDIRDMIDNKYLCDYTIHIPIFSDDPTNKNICEHLLKKYINIIIYCNSQKEGKKINDLLNKLQKDCSEYIDCNTPRIKRNKIIDNYKDGKISFLVNVRILVEGFDAPITKGVCFIHLPSSKTTVIQIIGRALRLHPLKTIANVILPFSSHGDETNINKFLKVLANNDKRIKQSYESKTEGGYISIEQLNNDNDEENKDIEFRYDMIYDSMGILKNGEDIWMKRLEEVKKYIDENYKRPSRYCKVKDEKVLGEWLSTQRKNYEHIPENSKYIMKTIEIHNEFTDFLEKYKEYFLDNNTTWRNNLKQVCDFIDKYHKKLSYTKSKYEKYLSRWLSTQRQNYEHIPENSKYIMKTIEIHKDFTDFLEKYKEYFIDNNTIWKNNLKQVCEFIDKYHEKPSYSSKNKNNKYLGLWLSHQQQNYKQSKQIMKISEIHKEFTDFLEKYKEYLIDNNTRWRNNIHQVCDFIDKNHKKLSSISKDKNEKILANWLSTQQTNYNQIPENSKEIMKTIDIHKEYTDFLEKYKEYFIDNNTRWRNNLKQVCDFIDKYHEKPSNSSKNKNEKILAKWLSTQQTNYNQIPENSKEIMKTIDIHKEYTDFLEKYKEYFIDNNTLWRNNLKHVCDFIDKYHKKPTDKDDKYLGNWLSTQQTNYKQSKQIMKIPEIHKEYTNFLEKYKEYFIDNNTLWRNNLKHVCDFIDKYHKKPSHYYKDDKYLGKWLSHQQTNYKQSKQIMKIPEIHKEYTAFLEKYKDHFI